MRLSTLREWYAPRRERRYRSQTSLEAVIPAHVESLEDRLLLFTLSGYEWGNMDVSFSYLPDGTNSEGYQSSLYAMLDAIAPTEVWQREFARALQSWANVSNLNFNWVADDGSASGTSGLAQGDDRFGDIRLGAHSLNGGVGFAYYPHGSSTLGGDITLDPAFNLLIGGYPDLYSILLHEAGHSLGLRHSDSGTVMYGTITAVYAGLTADDIAGIRAIYGARQADVYDQSSSNDTFATASSMSLDGSGSSSFTADLTSGTDVDYYRFIAPTSFDGTMAVSLDARNWSLLAPKLSVFDSAGNLVSTIDVGGAYGTVATLNLTGLSAGETYTIMADGATADEFGMGAYTLTVQFGGVSEPAPEPTPDPTPEPTPDPTPEPTPDPEPTVSADRFEVNDSFATAIDFGKTNGESETGLTFHTATDSDFFSFNVRKNGTFNVSALSTEAGVTANVTLYDADHNVIAGGVSQTGEISLASGVQYYVQVTGIDGVIGSYDFTLAKTKGGGGGNKGGGKGNNGKGGAAVISDGSFAGMNDYSQSGLVHRDNVAGSVTPFGLSTTGQNKILQPSVAGSTHRDSAQGAFRASSVAANAVVSRTSNSLLSVGKDDASSDSSFEQTDELFSRFEELLSEDQVSPLEFSGLGGKSW